MGDIERFYEIFGLKPGASEEDVKSAYRDLVQVWHPDRFSHNKSLQKKAEAKLKEINSAYEAVKTHIANTSMDVAQSGGNKSNHENRHNRTQETNLLLLSSTVEKGTVIKESFGKKFFNLILLFFILYAEGMAYIIHAAASRDGEMVKGVTSPEGLQVTSVSGSVDANQDFIVSGVIENTTDQERPDWYLVIDVYDARGTVLDSEKMWNGKQLYTKKDYEVLAKRQVNVQELREKNLHEPGVVIPPRGTVHFEIRFIEWPSNIARFNATLKPFDPIRLYKEVYLSNILTENVER
jgi:curved DNA-binding protein CbpA